MKITIGIITKNRPKLLSNLLKSILKNNKKPQLIIIVDNSNNKKTYQMYSLFKNKLKFTYKKKSLNIPSSRNLVIKLTKTNILAFVDDDCEVGNDWVENIIKAHKKHKVATAIQGKSILDSQKKWLSKILNQEYSLWIKRNLLKNKIHVIDTKNISLKLKDIKKNNIYFDNQLNKGSDIDMALQIYQKKMDILYNPTIIIKHKERNLLGIIKQRFLIGKYNYQVNKKWQNLKMPKNKIQYKISILSIFFLNIPYLIGYFYSKYFLKYESLNRNNN